MPSVPSPAPVRETLVSKASSAVSGRLLALDALRGFDMFWIVGAEDIVHSLHKVNHSGAVNLVTSQLTHKAWEGFAFYDLIFPLFVFIVGVSLVFSLGKTIEQAGKAQALRRLFVRAAILYVIGIIYYGGLSQGVDRVRLMGVLQRIALCYLFAGLFFTTLKLRGLIIACVSLLAGYWAMMCFIPVPGIGAGNFAPGMNLANYVDREFLPLWKWEDKEYDPEGLLSTLPAIGTCLLGVFAGLLLRNDKVEAQRKVIYLLGAGVAGVAAGFLWGMQFPIIKQLWTSSFVLVAGGFSCLFLAAFYQVIEIWKYQKWAMPFVWIGVNPITIYLAHKLIDFRALAERFVGGEIKASFGIYGDVLVMIMVLAMTFWIVRFLYVRKVFLRI